MAKEIDHFPAGVQFAQILPVISKQIYETPMAFIRENAQNAIDAIRIQARREGTDASDPKFSVDIKASKTKISVKDNGIGMTNQEMRDFFWTIGASGKRTDEAREAGCVGIFGIGGFANFGVCTKLEVTSQAVGAETGTHTVLTESEIKTDATAPHVASKESNAAQPHGTLVVGTLREPAQVEELKNYIREFVLFVPTKVTFNGECVSCESFSGPDGCSGQIEVEDTDEEWEDEGLVVFGRFFEDQNHALSILLESISVQGDETDCLGYLRFEDGPIEIYKRGFKICTEKQVTTIGVSGKLDCDFFRPVAGRASLDAESGKLLKRMVDILERAAVGIVLKDSARIAQHTRIFSYVVDHDLVYDLDETEVFLANGSRMRLIDICLKHHKKTTRAFYGTKEDKALTDVMERRGHTAVILSEDVHRAKAERIFLERYCKARSFEDATECSERYRDLTQIEKTFLERVEHVLRSTYGIAEVRLVPGKITKDIPIFLDEDADDDMSDLIVDVRHPEITKILEHGLAPAFYHAVPKFCLEYIGVSLVFILQFSKEARARQKYWSLSLGDIGSVVLTQKPASKPVSNPKRVLRVTTLGGDTPKTGHYIQLDERITRAYGEVIPRENLGVLWGGNRIVYVASESQGMVFQYEIKLDRIVSTETEKKVKARRITAPIRKIGGRIYFPIPDMLEKYLVPTVGSPVRLWFDVELIDVRDKDAG